MLTNLNQVEPGVEVQLVAAEVKSQPWEDWEERALSAGVSHRLARLGARVMRESWQHEWEDSAHLCTRSWNMTELALRSPRTAARLWNLLLETDGFTSAFDEGSGELMEFSEHAQS